MTDSSSIRFCPICSSKNHDIFMEEYIDSDKITNYTYASRKNPEYMCHQLVRCDVCQLVYTPHPPKESSLSNLYLEASYDSVEEANCAASSYAKVLKPFIKKLPRRNFAVDIGSGNGALLAHFLELGFENILGIEPSKSAIEAACEKIRPHLKQEMFSANSFENSADLICTFMTLEHVPNPTELIQIAYEKLAKGGILAIVVHDYSALLNRVLGRYSPIIDIEHLQLFCPEAVRELLNRANFSNVEVLNIKNCYNTSYWLRLAPLPNKVKNFINKHQNNYLLSRKLSLNVGNIMALGIK